MMINEATIYDSTRYFIYDTTTGEHWEIDKETAKANLQKSSPAMSATAERDQCCKDICGMCAVGEPITVYPEGMHHEGNVITFGPAWKHPSGFCNAYRIRERAFKEQSDAE